ncbi:hypothetical protein HanXRQr2_Chr10g0445361 [Helianthus annuus]|uniref:Uncharacterized protein n=1 Tax=Helianthus annuus TaxID=4232 RepID=A0A9K3HYV7_HELAN|nr:hypothetical protein HanXRQr2_Chr10g0445361 [Helianthus annuus]
MTVEAYKCHINIPKGLTIEIWLLSKLTFQHLEVPQEFFNSFLFLFTFRHQKLLCT